MDTYSYISDLPKAPRIGGLRGGGLGKENFTLYSRGFESSSIGGVSSSSAAARYERDKTNAERSHYYHVTRHYLACSFLPLGSEVFSSRGFLHRERAA